MRRFLGDDEYQQFAQSLAETAHTGLRINTLKTSITDFISNSPFALSPVGTIEPAGFLVTDNSRPGHHPYHGAGLFYLQEPSAMVVARLMVPQPGECILDLAAAPGGKTTHLASLMNDSGILVANDISRGRTRHLVTNLERWGLRNTLITSQAPSQLSASFGPVFDKVLVDAPCSGEAMVRRRGELTWSQEMVLACGRRQTHIMETAARLVRPGGVLAYATCSFSPEENEEVVGRFLAEQRDFELLHPPQFSGSSCGRPDGIQEDSVAWPLRHQLKHTVRIWPHRFAGEGQFLALLRRMNGDAVIEQTDSPVRPPLSRSDLKLWHQFAHEHLRADFPSDRLLLLDGRLFLRPERNLNSNSLRVIRNGLFLGELRGGYFKPAHALALAITPKVANEVVNWTADSDQTTAYLSGQSIRNGGPNAWVLVTVDHHALGWAKRVTGVLKNHYPRGLRQMPRR